MSARAATTASFVLVLCLTSPGCSKPLPREALEAGCKKQIEATYWKTWEAKVMADATWKLLPQEARTKLRHEAEAKLAKELQSPDAVKVVQDCVVAYSELANQAQLDCVVTANINQAGKAALRRCLEL